MIRTMLRSKIHRIGVTECNIEYEGSLTLDVALMEQGDMVPYEKVDVYDITNGNRFSTYLIEGERNGGACCVNGAAARLVEIGDELILASYTTVAQVDVAGHSPTVVVVGEANKVRSIKRGERAGIKV
jgi:aspartate 1-decarboxylase